MTTVCVVEVTKGLDGAKPKGAIQDVAVPVRANARPKVDGSAWKDAFRKNALEVVALLEYFLQTLVVVLKSTCPSELKGS